MRTEKEIRERIQSDEEEIVFWSNEKTNATDDDGYIDHCRECVKFSRGDITTLKWVLGE